MGQTETRVVDGIVYGNINVDFSVELTTNDIFNWLNECRDVTTLKYLGRFALSLARAIEIPNDDNDVYS